MKYFESFEEEVKATVKGLLKRTWKVDKIEKEKGKVSAIRISAKCFNTVYSVWIDIFYSEMLDDFTWDWNQYIFHDNNSFDCIYKELQNNEDFWNIADNLVSEYIG